jgi:hypothetical protein
VDEAPPSSSEPAGPGRRIGARYEVVSELGRGGMGQVYRVQDAVSGRHLALKQLFAQGDERRAAHAAALFEREFHVLSQLSHPHVIEVYDYGIDELGPFYTMELLDGGDLRERSPLPYREACRLIYDVCSSLGLLHARRLVHCDVSPRNIRCIRNGRAKLIDFGAMVPMGPAGPAVGTPAFVAPEVVNGSALDGRTDLYSLGATLYYALTGRFAYPAASFAQLFAAWANEPPPPSHFSPDVPEALDALVMSLLSLEPARRPRSEFEVMQRLAALAGIEDVESESVSSAYLATPIMVGREQTLERFKTLLRHSPRERGSRRHLLIAAAPGSGRSRMLDACALEAKTIGATVLRARADAGASNEFTAAHALVEQIVRQLPELSVSASAAAGIGAVLFEPAADGGGDEAALLQLKPLAAQSDRRAVQTALASFILAVAEHTSLLIAVDDVDRVDEASVALLTALVDRARRERLLITAASEPTSARENPSAFELLAGQCEVLPLRPLELAETEQLLGSVFGDAPNLALLCSRIHAIAAGNPRECMALAQYLVDQRRVVYRGGNWTLPETLGSHELPTSLTETILARVGWLEPLARRFVETQALSMYDSFAREDYAALAADEPSEQVDAAITALIAHQLLSSDGRTYRLANRAIVNALRGSLDETSRRQHHRRLADLCERTGRPSMHIVRELFLAGDSTLASERLAPILPQFRDRAGLVNVSQMNVAELTWTIERALGASRALARPAREICEVQRCVLTLSIAGDDRLYWEVARSWLERLELDSGLADWRALSDVSDSQQRLMQALSRAAERHTATPPDQRVYAVDEAIRFLIYYVVISIAVGSRTLDAALVWSLPELLEPFAPLSPLLSAIWQNALATRESSCLGQSDHARDRWLQVFEALGNISGATNDVQSIRYAIAFGLGLSEAMLGLESAGKWADLLDQDSLQSVNAMYLRKVLRMQQGDLEGAERFRKQAELLSVGAPSRQMFTNMLTLELIVTAAAWDLTGVQQLAARIEPLADKHRGWQQFRLLARAQFERLRGDLEAACRAFAECLTVCAPDPHDPWRSTTAWPAALSGYVETLVALDRAEQAKALAEEGFELCRTRGLHSSTFDIPRALALAEAKLGAYERAATLLDTVIARQRELGVTGLQLGASYEARARVAIWAGDHTALEHYARLVAEQFRHGAGSSLGARYQRLVKDARGAGLQLLPTLTAFESAMRGSHETARGLGLAAVNEAMKDAHDSKERAARALQLLCAERGASGGYLFLVQDSALELSAALGMEAPDESLQQLVSEFWNRQAADNDVDTTAQTDMDDSLHRTLAWANSSGMAFQPMLLTTAKSGVLVHAGIAVLRLGAAPGREFETNIASELGAHLIRAGDTKGQRFG